MNAEVKNCTKPTAIWAFDTSGSVLKHAENIVPKPGRITFRIAKKTAKNFYTLGTSVNRRHISLSV